MTTPAIQSALSQMQTLATQAAGQAAKGQHVATAVGQGGFANELQSSIQRINRLQQTANAKLDAFQSGEPGVALNDVMVDMQKASVGFQMGLQTRNRLVTAYKDIMNMQV
ncbi:flagellar hook-basal body complex protein FliE [Halomonas sp. McH1-25]|uniref:flagellar hook-basal body complex protein FliE n=1 Tax=unclassified Halomonas TaxID=2609666 RepID=UPI001EF43097|nr:MULTISPECIES: flagellar hook-basal body complex protein FliE [unclassified Halomonas]MCG7598642.1 flagellar hook-basal body complex protein FliE [Halomonas sp. McH1-25]MCP1343625.1 flagellar hook-basal body complex protein FliE [Halomonas sp. FL8]MCP1359376.1 flagellar hook-basal body complex protein FliE [Halomonas sp. BBD45]